MGWFVCLAEMLYYYSTVGSESVSPSSLFPLSPDDYSIPAQHTSRLSQVI